MRNQIGIKTKPLVDMSVVATSPSVPVYQPLINGLQEAQFSKLIISIQKSTVSSAP